jgi:hypothetical protein
MGFLNHATNNIIIDAVLTERGREYLSKNNGSFKISYFSFGDDEVDYSTLKKYGMSIGKEKIEKNTPIFEANPNENISIKHPCITFPNPLTRVKLIPSIVWSDKGALTSIELKSSTSNTSSNVVLADITASTYIATSDSSTTVDRNLVDDFFIIKMHSELLNIVGPGPDDVDTNGIASYVMNTGSVSATNAIYSNQRSLMFTVTSDGNVTTEDFTSFGSIGDANKINTNIQVIGQSTGSSLIIPVTITKDS